tara:strand:+ start:516 stop:950 length:435 start_codon:yes stop_codon:yes gene_type:complete
VDKIGTVYKQEANAMGGKRKVRYNPTVGALRHGLLRFSRRVDVPMWHVDHVRGLIPLMRQTADELDRIMQSNSLRNIDKTMAAQSIVAMLNTRCRGLLPADPRRRGSEKLVYDPFLMNIEGHDKLQQRDDLDEPGTCLKGRSGK